MKKTKAPVKAAKAKAKTVKGDDIIELILHDHQPLKKLIKVMKDSEASLEERKSAFEEFAPLLIAHAKSEETVLYTHMKKDEDLREEAFEGDVEHGLADQMLEEAKRMKDEDQLGARIKVLAELVEHHIKEEEKEMLPEFRKHSRVSERVELGEKYLRVKADIEFQGSDDAPRERDIPAQRNQEIRERHAS